MNFPAESVRLLSRLPAGSTAAKFEACALVASFARHMLEETGQPRQEFEAEIVDAMDAESRRRMFLQLISWGSRQGGQEFGFVPPWGIIFRLVESISGELTQGGESK